MYFLNIDRKASRIFLNKSDFQQFNLSIELYTNLTSNFTFDLLIELSRIITAFILSFHKVENLLLNTFFIDICTVTGHNFTFTYVQPKLSTRRCKTYRNSMDFHAVAACALVCILFCLSRRRRSLSNSFILKT